jgi:acyl-CoA synthetase (AMP-forming)/AMP-acid ligase II
MLLVDQLRLMAHHHPEETAYRTVDLTPAAGTGLRSITFAGWEAESNRLARGLVGRGIAKGDRVAVYLDSADALHWIIAYAAVHKAGAVAVPTNTRLVTRELALVLGHADITAIITGGPLTETAQTLAGIVITTEQWDDALDDDAREFQVPVAPDDLADIMYTSGTTGRPKGVVVRHRNSALIPNNVPTWTGSYWLHGSPLFTFAGISFIYNPMKMGMTALYMPKFDAGQWLAVVEQERPGAAFIVPAMAQLLIAHPRFDSADLSSLWMCSLGSAPLAPNTLRRLQDKLPNATVSNGYGMTEAGPAYCSMPKEESARRIGSVGLPMPPMEVRSVDPQGEPLPRGEVGEIHIRMPGREREYYNDPEATAATWEGGWLHTGDLGYLDADGYLYIVGRAKEVIIRGGNNIYATDIEGVLLEHPEVQDAAVVGVAHDVLGEDVAAFAVLRPGTTLSVAELQAFCGERLADYKVPRRITFVDELPRNATGKVLKHELIER